MATQWESSGEICRVEIVMILFLFSVTGWETDDTSGDLVVAGCFTGEKPAGDGEDFGVVGRMGVA